jgi:hypothetical protein
MNPIITFTFDPWRMTVAVTLPSDVQVDRSELVSLAERITLAEQGPFLYTVARIVYETGTDGQGQDGETTLAGIIVLGEGGGPPLSKSQRAAREAHHATIAKELASWSKSNGVRCIGVRSRTENVPSGDPDPLDFATNRLTDFDFHIEL